ncbi:MAG: DNA-binding protein [Candidatus Thermoplasmatota archaeon]
MDDLEALRQRRLAELQARQAQQAGAQQDAQAAAAQKADEEDAAVERILQQILEPEARERLTRIRMSRPELADAVAKQLVTLAQGGRLARRLTDEDLRTLLGRIPGQDRDIKITRK